MSAENTSHKSLVSLLCALWLLGLQIIVAVLVREEFERVGLQPGEPYDFKPHLTIAKMSKDMKAAKKVKKFDPKWFASFKDAHFGVQSYACEFRSSILDNMNTRCSIANMSHARQTR